jgi:hypothetical protein
MKHNDLTLKPIKGLHPLVTATLLVGLALTLTPVPVVHAATFDIPDGDVTALINAINTASGNTWPPSPPSPSGWSGGAHTRVQLCRCVRVLRTAVSPVQVRSTRSVVSRRPVTSMG